jgi:hypothetical protein
MTDPITPETAVAHKASRLPSEVIEVFNDLIADRFDGQSAQFRQEEAVEAIVARGVVPDRKAVFDRHWLDVEPVYRAAGWHVTYDKPGFNETYAATFTFTRLSRRDI